MLVHHRRSGRGAAAVMPEAGRARQAQDAWPSALSPWWCRSHPDGSTNTLSRALAQHLAGELQVNFADTLTAQILVRLGNVRVIAVMGVEPSRKHPNAHPRPPAGRRRRMDTDPEAAGMATCHRLRSDRFHRRRITQVEARGERHVGRHHPDTRKRHAMIHPDQRPAMDPTR